jgi:hypothetical protein
VSNFTTATDLLKYSLRCCGEVDDGTSPLHSKVLEYLNLAYIKILRGPSEFNIDFGQPFAWARKSGGGNFILQPLVDNLTVSLTNGSANGTFSVAPTTSYADYELKMVGVDDWFQVKTHTASATAFTMDCAFTGDTGNYTAKVVPIRYKLTQSPAILRLVEPLRVYRPQNDNDEADKIFGIEINSFRSDFPQRRISLGIPDYFSVMEDTDSVFRIIVNKYVDKQVKVDYDYIEVPTALLDDSSSKPIIPIGHRKCLADFASSLVLKDEKKQFEDANRYAEYAKEGLTALIAENNKKKPKYREEPWKNSTPVKAGLW